VGRKADPDLIFQHKPLIVHSILHFGSLNQISASLGILNVHRP